MQETIVGIMNHWGYLGVFLLVAVENIFPPIPSEVILLFGGALTATALGGKLGMVGMIVAATLGALVGAVSLYYIGKILKVERLKKLVSGKPGRVLRLKPADIERADSWFDDKGNITVLFCRCVPILRSLISIPAGMSEMPMGRFLVYTILGSAVWNTVLVVIGHNLGDNWQSILGFFDKFSDVVLAICVVVAVIVLVWWFGFRHPSSRRVSRAKEGKDAKESESDPRG